MSKHLWNVKAKTKWGAVLRGMEVEIVVENSDGKPSIKNITSALESKYSVKIGGGLPASTFDFYKL